METLAFISLLVFIGAFNIYGIFLLIMEALSEGGDR